MDGRTAASQPQHSTSQHQHPQADHVRTHVPENADASPPHKRGWALQWRTGTACGESGDATDITPQTSDFPADAENCKITII